jgi:tetratricopeptide (TPR) repeat protein
MKILEVIEKYSLYIVLSLFAVFVLPNFAAPNVVPKEILLVGGLSLVVLVWVIKMVVKGSLSFAVGKFDLGVLVLTVAYLVSTFIATPNKMEAYLFPGTTTFVVGGALLYFIINQLNKGAKRGAAIALFVSSLLLSLSLLLSSLGVFSKIPQLPAFVKDSAFNPMGGIIPSILVLTVFLIFSLALLLRESEATKKLFFGASMAIIVFALVVQIGSALPGKPQSPRFVDMTTSWEITVEALKKSPLFGAGPANYLTAFNLFRPLSYNQSELWQIRFTTASNYYFTLITETGFLGLAAILILFVSIYKAFSQDVKAGVNKENLGETVEKSALVLLLILFAVFPIPPTLLVFLFALLALYSKSENKVLHLNVAASDSGSTVASRVPSMIAGLPFIAGVIAVIFFGSRVVAAEATFKKSLDALNKNDAKGTFDLMTKSITQNQKVDRYHASLAQVDMALASSLAAKEEITDTDRNTITQLVQAAISEGKATVNLNPSRSGNWEVLAQIYRSIMPFATGADQFTIQTYSQAVALDPINPNLRISLGGVYYALGRYDDAIDAFKLAVLAKNDLPNAHYNLAVAYREKKDFDNAISEMNIVLSLVDANSQDYTLAKSTLDELEKNKPVVATETEGENLQAPQPVEPSNIAPPIELPEEATPPATTP